MFAFHLSFFPSSSFTASVSFVADPEAEQIVIPRVKGKILGEVVTYMQHHAGKEPKIVMKPLRSRHMKEVCPDRWDADFIDRIGGNLEELYELILVSARQKTGTTEMA